MKKVFFLSFAAAPPLPRASEHAKAFGISDGFEESLSKFLLGGVLRQEQNVKAGVRRW